MVSLTFCSRDFFEPKVEAFRLSSIGLTGPDVCLCFWLTKVLRPTLIVGLRLKDNAVGKGSENHQMTEHYQLLE